MLHNKKSSDLFNIYTYMLCLVPTLGFCYHCFFSFVCLFLMLLMFIFIIFFRQSAQTCKDKLGAFRKGLKKLPLEFGMRLIATFYCITCLS